MNPNRLTSEILKLPGNIRSPRLPGGTLITAALDRRLMGWSDRGGASRLFGEIWSEHCWGFLTNGSALFEESGTPESESWIVRLDDDPRIAIQAGRNKLPNPDFFVLSRENGKFTKVRAVDAKFAVDRLRRTQISAESTRELVELPESLARNAIVNSMSSADGSALTFESGMFLGPNSLLNNYFFEKLTFGDDPDIPPDELKLIPVDAGLLFGATEEIELIELLRSIDGVDSLAPEGELVLGMYYLRLVCAARWFETQSRMPLLSAEGTVEVEMQEVYAATERRITSGQSAYDLIEQWSVTAEEATVRQKRVKDAARLPISMPEIRKLVSKRGQGDSPKVVRQVRATLEQHFRTHLFEELGEIPPQPRESIDTVVERVSRTSRNLRTAMLQLARNVTDQTTIDSDSPPGSALPSQR